jgi:uncharacterized protein (DUF169 family)
MPSKASSIGRADGNGDTLPLDKVALAHTLTTTLDLRYPPVALTAVTEQPTGIESFAGGVPSACTFWRRCEQSVFFAPAEAHFNCPIGALTMGFSMPDATRDRLMELVGQMGEVGYLQAEEAANIPSIPGEKSGIVYGPLESFPLEPDAVLAWVSGSSAMLLSEATGTSRWTPEQSGTASFGRPSCAAIAVAVNRETPTVSLGCSGMRTFTEIDDALQLAVVPRPALTNLAERLAATARANAQIGEFYNSQKALFA